jgi:hypothetical protein
LVVVFISVSPERVFWRDAVVFAEVIIDFSEAAALPTGLHVGVRPTLRSGRTFNEISMGTSFPFE